MSISEDAVPVGSDSFWEMGQYKRTVKRVDDGLKLCHQLMALVKERGEIEENYAKELKRWSKKWADTIDKGPEYGTLRAGWQAPLTEAEATAQLHLNMKKRLDDDVHQTIKTFSKNSYRKNALGHIKESKDLEESFRKVQKPWAKQFVKVEKSRREYHVACKSERTAINADKNSQNDSGVSPDQMKKLAEKVDKCKDEREKAKQAYELALRDLNHLNPKYMEDMTMVFEQSQEMEEKRIKMFKEQLIVMHSCLNISEMAKLPQIYVDFLGTLDLVDSKQNLKWWEQHHGPAMSMNWPQFEEYSPELRAINKKQRENKDISDPVLIRNNSNNPDFARPPNVNGFNSERGDRSSPYPPPSSTQEPSQAMTPSGDEWTLEEDYSSVVGVQMRAIHNHDPSEDDELSLRAGDIIEQLEEKDDLGWCKGRKNGDIIEQLEEKDDLGWCKGRKNGKIGLYPDGYCEPV